LFGIGQCFDHYFEVGYAPETAETHGNYGAVLQRERLPAFPTDEVGGFDAVGVFGYFFVEDQALIFARFYAREPYLTRFGPSHSKRLALPWGMDAKHFSMYGQFILDEFVISELRAGNGWWANKFGIQTGLKYIDVLNVNNLDFQVEGNIVRPYTYTHFRTSQNMSHYGQQLAHPLGANFYEILAIARYQPAKRLNLRVSCSYAVTGQDTGLSNMGGNIFKNYNTRYSEYGNTITQGDKTTILYLDVYSSYMIKHNVFIWGSLSNRNSSSTTGNYTNKEMWVSLGLRLNIPHRQFLF